jgi:hypothetical protein
MAADSVDGEVNASASSLRLAAGANSGEARLVWRNARIRGRRKREPLELGEVRAGLVANGATMSGPIDSQGGSLALRGDWTLKERDAFTLALRMTPRTTATPDSSVAVHGRPPDGDGWRSNGACRCDEPQASPPLDLRERDGDSAAALPRAPTPRSSVRAHGDGGESTPSTRCAASRSA